MSLQTFAAALQDSPIASAVDGSRYILMAVQGVHLLGLTFLLAITLAFNLRVLRITLRTLPTDVLARALYWPFIGTLIVSVAAGVLLYLPRATSYTQKDPFIWKMGCLLVASVAQLLLLRKAFVMHGTTEATVPVRALSGLALILWLSTGVAGRAIGFV
jgi:hypothetical protein